MHFEIRKKWDTIWAPKSHMRDWEAIDPFTKKEIKVARGAGIGIIISEPHFSYVKLYYCTKERKIKPIFTMWDHSKEAKKLLSSDLGLGYELIYIKEEDKPDGECFVEPKDERDEKETLIFPWFPQLKELASFDMTKRKKVDTENKESVEDSDKESDKDTKTKMRINESDCNLHNQYCPFSSVDLLIKQ